MAVKCRGPLPRTQLRAILSTASGVDPADLQGCTIYSNGNENEVAAALRQVQAQQGPLRQQRQPPQPGSLRQQEQLRQTPQQQQQQRQLVQQHPSPPGLSRMPPQQQQQQQRQPGQEPTGRGQPSAPIGLTAADEEYPPPPPSPQQSRQPTQPQQQPLVIYRLKVASPEVAAKLVSAATKRQLHQAGTAVYVEHWLSPSQLSARHALRPFTRDLERGHVQWRWSLAQPTQVEQRVRAQNGSWHWLATYPSNRG